MKRKICVVTGTRAEYGLLYWLLKELSADADIELQIVATGMHLSPEFGLTYRQIESDGFIIAAKVEMLLSSDSPVGIAKAVGLGTIGFADVLDGLRPDIVVVLGDRFEILAAAQAALFARFPIAHIHGGETTEGAFDESIRHALTKIAQWHFVAAEPYRKRVIQLGEAPERVFNFGGPGLDHLERLSWWTRAALEQSLEVRFRPLLFLVTYHPATLGRQTPVKAQSELLAALDRFPEASVIFTFPNADTGSRGLVEHLKAWVSANEARAVATVSLGQERYLSLMREADVVIGNSSSGLTEAPALQKPTVNIGDRQRGRLKATSVIDVSENRDEIATAIRHALSGSFQATLAATTSLYGNGGTCRRIKDTLKVVTLQTTKSFFDLSHDH